jgi:hypothetical protein
VIGLGYLLGGVEILNVRFPSLVMHAMQKVSVSARLLEPLTNFLFKRLSRLLANRLLHQLRISRPLCGSLLLDTLQCVLRTPLGKIPYRLARFLLGDLACFVSR